MVSRHALRERLWLAILLVAPFMAQADATIANVATPSIHADLGASGAELELVIGGYIVAFAVLLITGARLGQTHGYKRMFMLGVTVFALASLACGLAPDVVVLIVARVAQGAGAALMFPQTLTGIQRNIAEPQRPRAIALYAIALSAGAVVGQILGGGLISADVAGTQWRAIFLINAPVSVAVLAAAYAYLPRDEERTVRQLDLVGVAALSSCVLLVVLPLVVARSEHWPLWVWLCLGASVPTFALFISLQRRLADRGGSPLVNVHILARPSIGWSLLTLLAATGTYYAILFTLAQYLQRGLGRSALVSGLTLVPWVAAFGLAGQLVSRLPAAFTRIAASAGCGLLTLVYVALSGSLFSGDSAETLLVPLLGLGGFGLGIQFNALIAHLTSSVPPGYAPDISGVSTTTLQIGGAIGVAAFGTLYLSFGPSGASSATHAFAVTTAALAAVALVASVTAYRATHGQTEA
jgi:MFS family permease